MDPQQKMKEMLAELWKQHRAAIEERVDILERACDAVGRGQLSVQEREEAQSAAHKLAGVLGTFGRTEGTNLARQIENWLADPETLPARVADLGNTLAALRNSIS